jgi:hypothetical protein
LGLRTLDGLTIFALNSGSPELPTVFAKKLFTRWWTGLTVAALQGKEINQRTNFMTYTHDIGNGQRLLVENDGDNTQVALSSGDSGQQQNQSAGFNTGKWSKPPELFRTGDDIVLRVESKSGFQFISIHGHQIESMSGEPRLNNAEKLALKESDEKIARMKSMKPMEPMKTMEPMKPMKPMN